MVYGRAGLTYTVTPSTVEVDGWIGKADKPHAVDDSLVGAMPKQHFQSMMAELEQVAQGVAPSPAGPAQPVSPSPQPAASVSPVQDTQATVSPALGFLQAKDRKRAASMAVASLALGAFGILLPLAGLRAGGLLIFVIVYLGIQGLKSDRHGIATGGLVFAGIDTLILIASLATSL